MQISVALCTYNGEKYIAEQLESILYQSLPVDQIVICDDGSTDDTMRILKEYEKKYSGILRIFSNNEQLGVTKNFEKAINLCDGEIIFLSDQDDIWLENKVKSIVNFFVKNPKINAVTHDLKFYSPEREFETTNFHSLNLTPQSVEKLPINKQVFYIGNVVTGAAFAFRKNLGEKFIFDNKSRLFLHDYQLAILFAKQDALGILFDVFGLYRVHSGQTMGYKKDGNPERKNLHDSATSADPKRRLKFLGQRYKHNYPHFKNDKKLAVIFQEDIETAFREYIETKNPFLKPAAKVLWRIITKQQNENKYSISRFL